MRSLRFCCTHVYHIKCKNFSHLLFNEKTILSTPITAHQMHPRHLIIKCCSELIFNIALFPSKMLRCRCLMLPRIQQESIYLMQFCCNIYWMLSFQLGCDFHCVPRTDAHWYRCIIRIGPSKHRATCGGVCMCRNFKYFVLSINKCDCQLD